MDKQKKIFRVNERHVRFTALLVFLLCGSALAGGGIIPAAILTVDFFIRAALTPRLSPLAVLARALSKRLDWYKKRFILYKPKRFAAGIGLVMSGTATILFLLKQNTAAQAVLSVLMLFSGLEAFLGFCAGCRIFRLLVKLKIVSDDFCDDCTFDNGEGI